MADVSIKYKGNVIAEMSESGTKTLETSGTYCEGDIEVEYSQPAGGESSPCKVFTFTSPAAVVAQFVTVVSGDPDVAAHYADENAMVTVRKITNNTSNGTAFISHTNHSFGGGAYGYYMNCNGTSNGSATIAIPLNSTASAGTPFARCDANGDIKVYAQRTANNFGGANYIITFSW